MFLIWIFLLLTLSFTSFNSLPVRTQFRLDNVTDLRFRLLMPNNAVFGTTVTNSNSAGRIAVSLFSNVKRILRYTKVNFSFVETKDFTSGIADQFGNYSGAIGYLQRNEADVAFQWARLDSFVGEPVTPGPPFTTGDIMIVTSKLKGESITLDILNTFNSVHAITYTSFGTCAVITALLLAFIAVTKKHRYKSIVRRFRQQLLRVVWGMISLVFKQDEFRVKFLSLRVLWAHFVLATFFAVFGVFLNSMSTDLVAQRPVRQIESLDDQLSDEFSGTAPTIGKNFFLYPLLLSARKGSKMHRLLELTQRHPEGVYDLKYTVDDLKYMRNLIRQRITDNKACLLILRLLYQVGKWFFCLDSPEEVQKAREAREMFGGGIIVWMTRRGWNDGLRRLMEYKLRSVFELGLVSPLAQDMGKKTLEDSLAMTPTLKTLKCMAGVSDEKERAAPLLTITALRSLLVLVLGCYVIALLFLAVELIVAHNRRWLRQVRRQLVAQIRAYRRHSWR